jgi:TRAP-type C4-dicarboxylate transport system permease small subunit
MTDGWPWCKQCESVLVALVALCIASICASVAIQIVSRTFGVAFMVWTDEVTRVAILWVTFLGSAVGVRRHSHFVIDLLVEALPTRIGRLLRTGIQFVTFLVVLLLLWTGWQLSVIGLGRVYPITRISQTWAFASVPVGAALMLLFACEQYVVRRGNEKAERPC